MTVGLAKMNQNRRIFFSWDLIRAGKSSKGPSCFFNLARGRRMWNVEPAVKTVSLICLFAAIQFMFVPDSDAQSARQLTRKIVPPSNNPPPGGSPASRPAPAPSRAVPPASATTNAVPAPPPPADAPARHKETAHYARWRDTVAPMMAEARRSVKFNNVFPDDAGWFANDAV